MPPCMEDYKGKAEAMQQRHVYKGGFLNNSQIEVMTSELRNYICANTSIFFLNVRYSASLTFPYMNSSPPFHQTSRQNVNWVKCPSSWM